MIAAARPRKPISDEAQSYPSRLSYRDKLTSNISSILFKRYTGELDSHIASVKRGTEIKEERRSINPCGAHTRAYYYQLTSKTS
jgi:hypothetical protein